MLPNNLTIKTATHDFVCPVCPTKVLKGDAYLQDADGTRFCFCQLPVRRLVPVVNGGKKLADVYYP